MSMRPPFRRAWRWPWRLWERGALGSCFSSLIPGVIIALVGRGRWLDDYLAWSSPAAGDPLSLQPVTREHVPSDPPWSTEKARSLFGGSRPGQGPLSPRIKCRANSSSGLRFPPLLTLFFVYVPPTSPASDFLFYLSTCIPVPRFPSPVAPRRRTRLQASPSSSLSRSPWTGLKRNSSSCRPNITGACPAAWGER